MGKSDIIVLLVILSVFVAVYLIAGRLFKRLVRKVAPKVNEVPTDDENQKYENVDGLDLDTYKKKMENEFKRIEKEQEEQMKR
ncbi:MAG: hypothetical protein PHE84_00185 [bacterium]|nr:hypothetical protein [bacterium]